MKSEIKDFPEFEAALKTGQMVYLFGTGISSALTGQPYSWWKWIADGIGRLTNTALAKQYYAQLTADDSADNMVNVAGKVLKEAKSEGVYDKWMRDSFETNPLSNFPLAKTLKKMLIAQDIFVTTNYDLLLEEATGLSAITYEEPDKAFRMIDNRTSTHVLHLHGAYDSKSGLDNIVADQDQYDAVVYNEGAQFIQNLLGTRTLVFIGCGKTTEDANIAKFIQFAKRHLKLDQPYYFLYNVKRPVDGMPDNIRLIPYGDQYEDLPEFLEDMAQTRLKAFHSRYEVVGRTVYGREQVNVRGMSGYHFAQEQIPFLGRKEELGRLYRFLQQKEPFAWTAVIGQAGSGKSRLALELLHRTEDKWVGFFLNESAKEEAVSEYIPFGNTIIVIDYVRGREKKLAAQAEAFAHAFQPTEYQLRIVFLESDGDTGTGSWYLNFVNSLTSAFQGEFYSSEYREEKESGNKHGFITLMDMAPADIEALIGAVCLSKGLPTDRKRDERLRKTYGTKFEKLQYRPLFVQMFVEAWADNKCVTPRYDSFEELLQIILKREQERWLAAMDHNQQVCNAWVRLLVRAACTGRVNTADLPEPYKADWKRIVDYNKNHTFPGVQRKENLMNLITEMCHSLDKDDTLIEPLYPDILKEYMMLYYLDEEERLELANELWTSDGLSFAIFLRRCISDFPYNDDFFQIIDNCAGRTTDRNVLLARLSLLQQTVIAPEDDVKAILQHLDREYEFWHSLGTEDGGEMPEDIIIMKFTGLVNTAHHYGGWSVSDMSRMMAVLDEALNLNGGEALQALKLLAVEERMSELVAAGFQKEALELWHKLAPCVTDPGLKKFQVYMYFKEKNIVLMEYLMQSQLYQGYQVLKEMEKNCDINDTEQVRMFALSCRNLAQFAVYDNNKRHCERALHILQPYYEKHSGVPSIASYYYMIQLCGLQIDFFSGKQSEDDREKCFQAILQIEKEIGKFELSAELSEAWSACKVFKTNFISSKEALLRQQIQEAVSILEELEDADTVPQVYMTSVMAPHKGCLGDKAGKDEVEKAFSYMLRFPRSESVRDCFFQLLQMSTDAGNKKKYMTPQVVSEAFNTAYMNPLNSSGIDEIDEMMMQGDVLDYLDSALQCEEPYRREGVKVYPNDPCPCGSGKKYKKCCGKGK